LKPSLFTAVEKISGCQLEEREFKAGTVEYSKADDCQAANIGTTETHNLAISAK
jgi:hypothetical protein